VLGQRAVEAQAEAAGRADVLSQTEVSVLPDDGVLVRCAFEVRQLGLAMEVHFVVASGRFSFASSVAKKGKGGILDNAIVWKFMHAGFMGAAKKFGQAILSELRSRGQ